jgi:hypothetical protein
MLEALIGKILSWTAEEHPVLTILVIALIIFFIVWYYRLRV